MSACVYVRTHLFPQNHDFRLSSLHDPLTRGLTTSDSFFCSFDGSCTSSLSFFSVAPAVFPDVAVVVATDAAGNPEEPFLAAAAAADDDVDVTEADAIDDVTEEGMSGSLEELSMVIVGMRRSRAGGSGGTVMDGED